MIGLVLGLFISRSRAATFANSFTTNVVPENVTHAWTATNTFIAGDTGTYQFFIQNTNNGNGASADLVLGNDQSSASSTSNFFDVGINSSTFNTAGNIGQAGDSFIFAANSNLWEVVGSPTGAFVLQVGSTNTNTGAIAMKATLGSVSFPVNTSQTGQSNRFVATTYWIPTNYYISSGTFSTSGARTLTSGNGAFGGTNLYSGTQGYGNGYQLQIPTNGTVLPNGQVINNSNNPAFLQPVYQVWVWKVNSANNILYYPTGAIGRSFTNASIIIYPPNVIYQDATPNPQANVQADGTYENSSGSFSQNALTGGGYVNNDGDYTTGLKMGAAGGKYGECFQLVSLTNGWNPTINISPLAPNYSFNILTSGVNEFLVGVATGGTVSGTITSTGFTNTTGTNVYVNVIGAGVATTIKNCALTAVATNIVVAGGTIIPLQAGGAVSAAAGLSGTWWVQ